MNRQIVFSGIMILSVLVSSISQILLKKAAAKTYQNRRKEYLNFRVIFSYGLFFLSTLITILALKYIPLSFAPVLESTGYIFVLVLSYIFLHERMKKEQVAGMLFIMAGIVVYSYKLY